MLESLSGQYRFGVFNYKVEALFQDAEELSVSEIHRDASMGVKVLAYGYVAHLDDKLLHCSERNEEVPLTYSAKLDQVLNNRLQLRMLVPGCFYNLYEEYNDHLEDLLVARAPLVDQVVQEAVLQRHDVLPRDQR